MVPLVASFCFLVRYFSTLPRTALNSQPFSFGMVWRGFLILRTRYSPPEKEIFLTLSFSCTMYFDVSLLRQEGKGEAKVEGG